MKISELDFEFPESLIATEPVRPSRVYFTDSSGQSRELTPQELLQNIPAGDVFVINDTKVIPRRIFWNDLEILFVQKNSEFRWQVLFPSRGVPVGGEILLPDGVTARLIAKGRPQEIQLSRDIDDQYFEVHGQMPLPPYIQKQRNERMNRSDDRSWYQTAWAAHPGSSAAPTASLHFSDQDLENLRQRGVQVEKVTLHVGLGTFLPVQTEDLRQHPMHEESVSVERDVWERILQARQQGRNIWALGTTVTRVLESVALGKVKETKEGFRGSTDLLILPGHDWKVITRLMTNFHQPRSTLLALVCAFAGRERVLKVYQSAIEKKFRLFSYGDLTVWMR